MIHDAHTALINMFYYIKPGAIYMHIPICKLNILRRPLRDNHPFVLKIVYNRK